MTSSVLSPVIRAANEANMAQAGDYTQNGLLHCGKCRTPKQTRVTLPGAGSILVGCLCRCGLESREKEREARRRQEEMDKLDRLRSVGIVNQKLRGATFDADDRINPGPMEKVRRYAEKWEAMREKDIGLLLYGGVGTGKSFAAACVANYLIDHKISAFMTNPASILNMAFGSDKNEYISDLMKYPLLILDDFGMERNTDYATEQMFNIVDARYRSGKPLIVTTNLSLQDLKNPQDMAHRRIYDRVLEMCVPLNFGAVGRRAEYAKEKVHTAAELLT